MNKKILLGFAIVSAFASCKGDYDDWATPQTYAENDPVQKFEMTVQPTVSSIDFAAVTAETIQLFTTNVSDERVSGFEVLLAGENANGTATLDATVEGNVPMADIESAVVKLYNRERVERNLTATVTAYVTVPTADGSVVAKKTAAPFALKVTLNMPPIYDPIYDTDPVLYLTGDHYNWGGAVTDWKPLVPVHSHPTLSWTIIYLHEGENFKFAPQQGWGDDFGMSATIIDNAGVSATGSDNIVVGNAGWYLIVVDNTEGARTVTFNRPNIYLIGDASAASWSVDESQVFTVPEAEDGDFVSPEFVKDATVRMCISVEGVDWWQTEFIVNADGVIQYRGAGDDQARVNVLQGQRCYICFTRGAGDYK